MYAKAQGVMFDREQLSHPARIKKAVDAIDRTKVVNAFIHSLSTHRLVYRSFLSSYCMGKNLPAHDFTASAAPNESICAVCGLSRHAINLSTFFHIIVLAFKKRKTSNISHNPIGIT